MQDAPDPTRNASTRKSIDPAVWKQITGLDARLLDALAFLSRLQAKRSPSGALYCYPGRTWLARHLDCSLATVSRHTSKLARLGLISKTQRRRVHQYWQTCLYRLTSPTAWHAAALLDRVKAAAHRMSTVRHIVSLVDQRSNRPPVKESLSEIIARGMRKFSPHPA